jgi:hypothetical protein
VALRAGSLPQRPLPWRALLASAAALWLAPVLPGLLGLGLFLALGQALGEAALALWAASMALCLSPLFSWIGWLIALPAVALALRAGWFGWAGALAIGAGAGFLAGEAAQSDLGLPFGLVAILALRALLGRRLAL